ncbi:protein POOR HOMOLOGOUS SYNAPSIS 1-like [Papaver somniferum]|uniref:protein POOR HOMOLOGOUS SYNAPSIS 1-like n=1 Tax=Papaver somniferum TaxID=3469 RepID=UPI000E7058C9|nr:protein POOR HOMOLOGOUS SYNAPSIS 1-like [Papaver somniferum]
MFCYLIQEHHFVCNLHFSWPQVSCDIECPPRGSRVIFASYRDCDSQMQKFAMRFRVASDAQVFMDFIRVQPSPPAFIEQESLTNKNMIGNSETDLRSEISSDYEFVSSNGPCYRISEENPLNAHPTDYFMNPLETTRLLELPPVATDSAELSPAATYSPKMP